MIASAVARGSRSAGLIFKTVGDLNLGLCPPIALRRIPRKARTCFQSPAALVYDLIVMGLVSLLCRNRPI